MLKFSDANTKIKALREVPSLQRFLAGKRKVYSCDLLSGFSCPYAEDCLSKAVTLPTGKRKIKDGPKTKFRCFSASQEVLLPNVYNRRNGNFQALRGLSSVDMARLIRDSLPEDLGIGRIHVGGDFFNIKYMLAWASVAETHPDRLFYAYTKSLPFWVKLRPYIDSLPNFVLTASWGGRRDDLIVSEGLRSAVVLDNEVAYATNSLPIDHDDSHAADPTMQSVDFALLIHGAQPAGSEQGKFVRSLKGVGSYGKGTKTA